jgi:catechol 2,3-dioxygenase-like lactoylglutathione lyase family enzyme
MGALGKAKLVCFGATASAAKAKAFALVFDAGGTTLRIQKVEAVSAPGYTALGWEVDDIHAAVRALAKKGIRFQRYDSLTQDASGIWKSPGGALVAWFHDPDGATISLTELPIDV